MRNSASNFNRISSKNALRHPCAKDCPDRKAKCAVTCEKWAAYVEERNRRYEEKLKGEHHGIDD